MTILNDFKHINQGKGELAMNSRRKWVQRVNEEQFNFY